MSLVQKVQNPYAVTLDTTSEETRLDGRRVVVGLKDNAAGEPEPHTFILHSCTADISASAPSFIFKNCL